MGDFFQLQAVGDESLPSAAIKYNCAPATIQDQSQNGAGGNNNLSVAAVQKLASLVVRGGELIQSFRLRELTQQMQVNKDDPHHAEIVSSFQHCQTIIKPGLVDELERMFLTKEDVLNDPSWMEANILVPSNQQRQYLLPEMVKHYARLHGLPIVRWRLPLSHHMVDRLDDTMQQKLYDAYPELTGYFVKGAPVFLTHNFNPSKGLANGTSATMHSLSWEEHDYVEEIASAIAEARAGEYIDVNLPLSVNVEVAQETLRNTKWTCR